MGNLFMYTLVVMQGGDPLNTLESSPSEINGLLRACDGDQISLSCSHDNAASASTRWIISPPVNCSTVIDHNPPIALALPMACGSFMFQDLTLAVQGSTKLNSSAVATSSISMSGSVVECRGGNEFQSDSVGNITLCIIG